MFLINDQHENQNYKFLNKLPYENGYVVNIFLRFINLFFLKNLISFFCFRKNLYIKILNHRFYHFKQLIY